MSVIPLDWLKTDSDWWSTLLLLWIRPWRGVLVDPPPAGSGRMVRWLRFWQVWSENVPSLATCSQCHLLQLFGKVNVDSEFTKAKSGNGKICRAQQRWVGQDGQNKKQEKKQGQINQCSYKINICFRSKKKNTYFAHFNNINEKDFDPYHDLTRDAEWVQVVEGSGRRLHPARTKTLWHSPARRKLGTEMEKDAITTLYNSPC